MPMERQLTPYELWAEGEGIPVVRGWSVDDLFKVRLAPWARIGGLGALINLEGGEGWMHAYVAEIPAKAPLKPQRYLFEEEIYVLKGKGVTEVWVEGAFRQSVEWQAGTLFSVPLNAWHQHRNTGGEAARYVAVTTAPMAINWYRDPDFVFGCDYAFRSRLAKTPSDYYTSQGEKVGHEWRVNVIPDVAAVELPAAAPGSGGYAAQVFRLVDNTIEGHIGTIPVGTYKKAHLHWAAAHLIVIRGEGYTLLWPAWPPGEKKVRVDWKAGSIFSPPGDWFHQHFNSGPEPARLLALRRGNDGVGRIYNVMTDIGHGGTQIAFSEEEPEIAELYETELRRKGLSRVRY